MRKKLQDKMFELSYLFELFISVIVGIAIGIDKYKEYKYKQTNEYKLTAVGYTLEEAKKIILSNKERIALIKAIFIRYLPLLFGVIACFAVAMLLIYLWLN